MVDRMDVGQYRPGRLSTAEEEAVDGHHHLRVDARRPTAWCRSGPASCGSGSSHGSTSRRAPGVRCLSSQTFYEHRSTPAQPRLWRGTRPPSATLKLRCPCAREMRSSGWRRRHRVDLFLFENRGAGASRSSAGDCACVSNGE
jgi:hypothetical protein